MLDELQVVAGPGANVGVEPCQALVQLGRLEIVGHDQEVDVRVAVGVAPGHRAEEPGTRKVGPPRDPLTQSPDQLASQTRQGQYRPGREVASVQHNHRRSAGDGLAHESGSDELLDDGAPVARGNTGRSSELPPGDRLRSMIGNKIV